MKSAIAHNAEAAGWVSLLTVLARQIGFTRTVEEIISLTAGRLEASGFKLAVIERQAAVRVRWLTDSSDVQVLREIKGPAMGWLEAMNGSDASAVFLEKNLLLALPAILVPLSCPQPGTGLMALMHERLSAAQVPAFSLFGAVFANALESATRADRLARQSAELELVHELAVLGPRADATAVSERALRSVCRSTESQAAALHRYDPASGDFVLVGDVYGPFSASGAGLVEEGRRFPLPKGPPLLFGPASAAQVVSEAEELRSAGLEHTAIVPLFIEEQPVGLLTLARSVKAPYTDAELRGAEVLGVQMASLLERARLYDEASQLYIDLKKSYDELARTQAELVRHERLAALGELAAVMAHEVRNPLGVIFNSLTTLKRLLHPTGDAEMLLTMVGEEADRLNRIVADLLDFARPYELTKRRISIEPVIAGAIAAATKAINSPHVKVVTQIDGPLPLFPVDAHFVRQGLVNLLVNAMQAMPKGGTVTVRAMMESGWLVIDVSDEGVGLSPRAAGKIFQPFFTTKATGTGLGLAVVKRIVDAHQGEVSAQINPSGRGTTFRCRFPNLSDPGADEPVAAG